MIACIWRPDVAPHRAEAFARELDDGWVQTLTAQSANRGVLVAWSEREGVEVISLWDELPAPADPPDEPEPRPHLGDVYEVFFRGDLALAASALG
jgi:hypothetical protein